MKQNNTRWNNTKWNNNMQWSNNMQWQNAYIGEKEWKERRIKQITSQVLIMCTLIIIMGIWGEYLIRKTAEATTESVIKAVTEAIADEVSEDVAEKVKGEVANILLAKEVVNEMKDNKNTETKNTETKSNTTIKIVKSTSIFKEPKESSEVLKALGPGEKLTLEQDIGKGWLKVSNDIVEGYVYYYLTDYKPSNKVAEQNNSVKGKTGTTKKICSLREKPGISEKQIKFINIGSKLKLLSLEKLIQGEKYGWYKVEVDNEIGYIYGEEISIDKKVVAEKATAKKERIKVMKNTNIYKEPTKDTEVLTRVKKGAKLLVQATENPEWLEVVNGDNNCKAYIHYLYTNYAKDKKVKTQEYKKETSGAISAKRVNLREKPGTYSRILDCLYMGTTVNIIAHVEMIPGEEYGWYKIKTQNGQTGYVYGEFVARGEEAEAIKNKKETIPYSRSSNNSSSSSNNSSSSSSSSNNGGNGKKKEGKATYQAYAKQLCEEKYNWGEDQFNDLVELWEHESGWNPNDSYGSCYGIPQRNGSSHGIPDSFKNDWQEQIRWGLEYINGRYGNPSKAWEHFCKHNWY